MIGDVGFELPSYKNYSSGVSFGFGSIFKSISWFDLTYRGKIIAPIGKGPWVLTPFFEFTLGYSVSYGYPKEEIHRSLEGDNSLLFVWDSHKTGVGLNTSSSVGFDLYMSQWFGLFASVGYTGHLFLHYVIREDFNGMTQREGGVLYGFYSPHILFGLKSSYF